MPAASDSRIISDEEHKENTGRAIGRIATGVYILTVKRDGKLDGMLTSWICQAAFEPPMLSVAVKKERPILAQLREGQLFAVNVLSKTNMDIFKNFAKPHEEGLDRFAGLKYDGDAEAGPIFDECVASMSCRVAKQVDAGDHVLVLAEIVGGQSSTDEAEPMVHLRKSGFHY